MRPTTNQGVTLLPQSSPWSWECVGAMVVTPGSLWRWDCFSAGLEDFSSQSRVRIKTTQYPQSGKKKQHSTTSGQKGGSFVSQIHLMTELYLKSQPLKNHCLDAGFDNLFEKPVQTKSNQRTNQQKNLTNTNYKHVENVTFKLFPSILHLNFMEELTKICVFWWGD